MTKRYNVKRIMVKAVKLGKKRVRINSISPRIIVTPLTIDEFNWPRGDFYKNMFTKCPADRLEIANEVASVVKLLLEKQSLFITKSDFLINCGATDSHFYGSLRPDDK